jgi:hypothetical protein
MPSGNDELLNVLISHYKNGTLSFRCLKRMHSYLSGIDYLPLPSDSDIWKTMGNTFFKEKDYGHALACYKNAITIDRTNTDALHNIGITFRVTGRTEDANTIFAYIKSVEKERLAATGAPKKSIPDRSWKKKYGLLIAVSVIAFFVVFVATIFSSLSYGNSENVQGIPSSTQDPVRVATRSAVPTQGPLSNQVPAQTTRPSPVQTTSAPATGPGGNLESGLAIKRLNYVLDSNHETVSLTMYSGIEDEIQSEPEPVVCYRYVGDPSPCTVQENQSYFLKYINNPVQDQGLDQLIEAIRQKSPDRNTQAKIAISLVQNIPYDTTKSKLISSDPTDVHQNYPYETLYTGKGVCIDKSLLLVYILDKLGFDTVLFTFSPEHHAAVGIKCDPQYAYRGTGYCFVETTEPTIITDSAGPYVDIGRLTSMPQLYHMSNGTGLSEIEEEYNDAKRFDGLVAMGKANNQRLDPLRYADWKSLVEKYGLDVGQ